MKRPIVVILALAFMFQSCSIYRANTVSLEEASEQQTKVKVRTNGDENLKFKRIEYVDHKFYGLTKKKGEWVKVELKEDEIKSIRPKNKGLSTFMNILMIGTLALMAPAIAFAAGGGI